MGWLAGVEEGMGWDGVSLFIVAEGEHILTKVGSVRLDL